MKNVILVVPPIASVARPNPAISTLKAALSEIGCEAPVNFDSIKPLATYEYVYKLSPVQLARIAYVFSGHSNQIISEHMHAKLVGTIDKWRKRFWDPDNHPILASVPFGESLVVRDTRSIASEQKVVLDPTEAQVLARARSPLKLDSLTASSEPGSVQKLLSLGFLVRSGDQVLSVVKEFGWSVRNISEPNEQPCGSLKPA